MFFTVKIHMSAECFALNPNMCIIYYMCTHRLRFIIMILYIFFMGGYIPEDLLNSTIVSIPKVVYLLICSFSKIIFKEINNHQ